MAVTTRGVQIVLSADTAEILDDLDNVEIQLLDMGEAAERAGQDVRTSMGAVRQSSAQASRGIQSVRASTGRANQTLQEFGFIAGDAAFGIRGIANNIPQAVQSFTRLQQTAGGTGAALRTLLGSLTGAGGLILFTQLASTLLILSQRMDLFGDSTSEASDELTEAEEAAQGLAEELISLNEDASPEGIAADVNQLNDMLAILQSGFEEAAFGSSQLSTGLELADRQVMALNQSTGEMEAMFRTATGELIPMNEAVEASRSLMSEFGTEAVNQVVNRLRELKEEAQQNAVFEELARILGDGSDEANDMSENVEAVKRELEGFELGIPDEFVANLEEINRELMRTTTESANTGAVFDRVASQADILDQAFDELLRRIHRMNEETATATFSMEGLNQAVQDNIPDTRELDNTVQQTGDNAEAMATSIRFAFDLMEEGMRSAQGEAVSFQRVIGGILQTVGAVVGRANPALGAGIAGTGTLIQSLQSGGIVNRPLQIVGESGPELRALPRGTRVVNNQETERIIERTTSGSSEIVAAIHDQTRRLERVERTLKFDPFNLDEQDYELSRLQDEAGFPDN